MSGNIVKAGDRVRVRSGASDGTVLGKRGVARVGVIETVFTRFGVSKARVRFAPLRRGAKGFTKFVDPQDLVPLSRTPVAQGGERPLKIRRREVGRNSGVPRGMVCGPLPQYQVVDGQRIIFRGETIGQAEDWIAANHPGRTIIRQIAI